MQSWLESMLTWLGVFVDNSKSVMATGEPIELFEQPTANAANKATPAIMYDVRINLKDA